METQLFMAGRKCRPCVKLLSLVCLAHDATLKPSGHTASAETVSGVRPILVDVTRRDVGPHGTINGDFNISCSSKSSCLQARVGYAYPFITCLCLENYTLIYNANFTLIKVIS
jgi:hypothetical protein